MARQLQGWGVLLVAVLGWLTTAPDLSKAQTTGGGQDTNGIQIVQASVGGSVEVLARGASEWFPTTTNAILHEFDRIRTGPNTRITLRWSDQSVVPIDELTELEILPPNET